MADRGPSDHLERLAASDISLKRAFQEMETQSVALQAARVAGNQLAFDTAVAALRRAQVTFLRELNNFPADTARFLAERQNDLIDSIAIDGLDELSPEETPPRAPKSY